MLWHGRLYGCGSWLPEDKKANMSHIICSMEGGNVVDYGRLPSPAPIANHGGHGDKLYSTM